MEEGLNMGWLPTHHRDSFWFLISPLTTAPLAVYTTTGYLLDDYPLGKPDWRSNVRNAGIWGAIAGGNWAWNAYFHPGKYAFLSGSGAYKIVGHSLMNPQFILPVAATAAAVGWAATGHHHGAVAPGVASGFGMPVTPGIYDLSQPDGGIGSGLRAWWDALW